jgi:hypothetical protein
MNPIKAQIMAKKYKYYAQRQKRGSNKYLECDVENSFGGLRNRAETVTVRPVEVQ